MEGQDKFGELLVSYLLNELDSEEEALVSQWLNADQQNRLYLEEIKRTLNLVRMGHALDKVNVENEWNRFEQARQGKEQKPVFLNDAERFGHGVLRELGLKRKTSIYRTIAVTAVAACIILAIGLGWSLFNKEKPTQQTVTRIVKEKADVSTPFIRSLVNNTGASKRYELEDGSVVLLSPKSQLSFQEPFESNKRDLQLKGKADFQVAKNNLKPFTVFSGELSTTALGTRFTVSAFENSNNIYVRLIEGRVVVKARIPNQSDKKNYYLFPGQELVYNTPDERTRIWAFKKAPAPVKTDEASKSVVAFDDPSIPKYGRGSWYMFNNQPLSQVLDQLADMYDVEIHYSKNDIAKMYFIGKFEKSDSLEIVLNQITKVNKLKLIRKNNNNYTIGKK